MSIKRRQNWLGQQRVDAPHLKSIESAVSNDFDELLSGLVTGADKSYVVRGLKINMPGSIGASANGLQLIVENSAFLHGASNESGTFYTIPEGTPTEVLSSTTNARVQGSFTPNTDNYVGIEFIRQVNDDTADQVYFWNPTTNVELSRTVPLAIILDYRIVIATSAFADNVLPIAVVQTDSANNVVEITDRRPLLYRLGTAGDSEPDPFYEYNWPESRVENFYASTSSTLDPFSGGDKAIGNMKDFFDSVMTELKLLKGTPYWYSQSNSGSLYRNRQDLGSTAFTGKGKISHALAFFEGQVAGMTTDVVLKAVSTSVTLTADGVKDIDTLISEHNVANNDDPVYLISGDGSQIPTADIVMTSTAGQINWSEDVFLKFIGGRLEYKIEANTATSHVTLADNQVAYIKLVRGINIIPNLIFIQTDGTPGGDAASKIVESVGAVNWTTDLEPGDFIKDASRGDEYYYQIASVDSLSQVTLTEPFQETSSGPSGFDAQYAWGVYETSAAPSTDRHVTIADRGSVPFEQDVFWLYFRSDDGGSPQVYIRMLGGRELEQGEEREVSDNTSQSILNYIGAANESDNTPDYTNATGSAITNLHLIDSENLTLGMKRLEHRDDVVPRVRLVDIVRSSLPTGASVTIDGETVSNGDYVFFTNSAIEGLYKVSGVGVAVAFEKINAFKGLQTPVDGDLIRVENGTSYFRTIWKRVGTEWKPLEVKEATKEPTGFPNRVDSEMEFDNLTRTFKIRPKAPQTYFDIFIKGKPYRFETEQTITSPDDEGIFFFYFDDGVLTFDNTFDLTLITENAWCATVYWDKVNQVNILLGDERHGIKMDAATHEYLHNLNGTVLTRGGDIGFTPYEEPAAAQFDGQVAGMTTDVIIDADNTGLAGNVTLVADSIKDIDQLILDWNTANPTNTLTLTAGDGSQVPTADIVLAGGIDGSGDTDDDAQISLNDMTLRDEDIVMNIKHNAAPSEIFQQILDPIAEIPVYYRNGASGDWRKDPATQYPVKQGAARIQYNNPVGPWTQEDIQEGYYTSMWIYATNNQDEPVIAILGQAEHSSLSTAQELDTPQSLNFGALPSVEFKLLYRCIFQSSSAFANTPSAALVDVRDLRAVEDTQFAQVAPNDHGSLSGLEDPDHPTSAINTDGVEKDGGLSESDIDAGEAFTTLNRLLGQLRIKPHPVNGDRVIVTGADRILNSGTTLIQEIRNLVVSFDGAEIDFIQGQVYQSDGVTPLGLEFSDFTTLIADLSIGANEYLNYSITLIPAEVNADNTISAQLIVLPASAANAVKADAPKAPFAQGTKLGQVTVRESGGGIETIDEASIAQLGTGGGGSGGTGDANELLERLKNRLDSGTFEYMTPVVFSSVEEDLTDDLNTTATYSVVNSNYDFENVDDVFTSVQMLDAEFLAEEIEVKEIELIHYWNLEALDSLAVYEVSRNGGNEWQTVSMSRIGQSDTYRGIHSFAEEAANSYTVAADGAITDLTDVVEPSRAFSLLNTTNIRNVAINLAVTGSPVGFVYLEIVKDNGGGSPSTDPLDKIAQSGFIDISGIATGVVDFPVRFTAVAGDYHVILKTEQTYKDEYTNSAGANKLTLDTDIDLQGIELDLRVRITGKTAEVVSEGFGVYYKSNELVEAVGGTIYRDVQTFDGTVDNFNEFTISFLPDPRLLHVYALGTGQVFRYGDFVMNGNIVTFPPDTFNVAGNVSLEFLQVNGGSFDNSDENRALLAANHLGSTNPAIDMSVAGRGWLSRSPDGTLYEIVIQDGGTGFDIYEVD